MSIFFIAVFARSIDSWNSEFFWFRFWMIRAMFPKMIELMIAPRVTAEAQKKIFHCPLGVISLQVSSKME